MTQAWEHHLPTRIRFGSGELRKLGEVVASLGRSALIVGYRDHPGLEENYDRAVRFVENAGVAVQVHLEVPPEPPTGAVQAAAEAVRQAAADVVIGIGGGSVIDVAKAAAWSVRTAGDWSVHLTTGKPVPAPEEAIAVVAVPTTAGTGSEVSDIAVLGAAGPEGAEVAKGALFGAALRPTVALIDPELSLGSPPALTAACAADALGHALEASISRRAHPLASLMAQQAVVLIHRHLVSAVRDPADLRAREALALAALLGGVAFTEAGVVVSHALAQALGGVLGVPHGAAVAIATPAGLRHNLDQCRGVYEELGRACGLEPSATGGLAESFLEATCELLRSAGLPDRVAPPGDPAELIPRLVDVALRTARTPLVLNPRRVNAAELQRLFAQIVR